MDIDDSNPQKNDSPSPEHTGPSDGIKNQERSWWNYEPTHIATQTMMAGSSQDFTNKSTPTDGVQIYSFWRKCSLNMQETQNWFHSL